MAKVSVIVPVYNVEKYLRECLDSIVNQTLEDIEIICVNDGSTDSSLSILEEYAKNDSRVKIIDKQNSGYGNSMNRGLDSATGEYIGIVESDDFIKPEMYEELYALAKENDADIVKGDFYHYTTYNNDNKKIKAIKEEYADRVINAKKCSSILEIYPSIWSAIYKREFIEKNSIRFLETPGASYQDTGFTFKTFALAERVYMTTKPYLYYRQDNINSSVNSKTKVYVLCDEYEEITRFVGEHPEISEFGMEEMCINQYVGYKWNLKRISDEYKTEFTEMFAQTFKKHLSDGYLGERFNRAVNKDELELLTTDVQKYIEFVQKEVERENKQKFRRKMFSVRIKPDYIRVVLLGKVLINWER